MINIKNLDPNKIKIDKTSNKNILLYYIGYIAITDLSYVTINRVNPSYFIIYKIRGYIEKSNAIKYIRLVSTDESKDTLKKYKEFR